jgi:hypoxanthine phosphoribosyltransferase
VNTGITVKTLDDDALAIAAQQLAAKIVQDYAPDIVIGIRTGGYTLAALMMQLMPHGTPLAPLTCRRHSTHTKTRFAFVKQIVRKLPYFLTNRLRVIEHTRLMRTRQNQPLYFSPDTSEVAFLKEIMERIGKKPNILIIDDAVDSGATLAAVISVIHSCSPSTIKIAAITTTMPSPLVQPDFTLYNNVLCRFPWSLDFKR